MGLGDDVQQGEIGCRPCLAFSGKIGEQVLSLPLLGEDCSESCLDAGAPCLVEVVVSGRHEALQLPDEVVLAAALRSVLKAHPDVLVVEDDHLAELSSVPLHSLAGATRSWAFLRSVSKPYGPDLRLAALAGDEATVARVVGRMRLGAGWISTLLQRLVVELWRDDRVAATVAHAGREYDQRRRALLDALHERHLTASGRTGINVWVCVADETLAVARLRDSGYAVAPGSFFRLSGPPAIRITTKHAGHQRRPAAR